MPERPEPSPAPTRRYALRCAYHDYSAGTEVVDARSVEEAFDKALAALDAREGWQRTSTDAGPPYLLEASDADTGQDLAVPHALSEAGRLEPRPDENGEAASGEPGEYTVCCAFARYEYATTTVRADNAEAACARAQEELQNDWDAWELGPQSGPVFVERLEQHRKPLPVPRPFRSPRA